MNGNKYAVEKRRCKTKMDTDVSDLVADFDHCWKIPSRGKFDKSALVWAERTKRGRGTGEVEIMERVDAELSCHHKILRPAPTLQEALKALGLYSQVEYYNYGWKVSMRTGEYTRATRDAKNPVNAALELLYGY